MDEIDKKLFDDLSEQVEIPIKCEYVIRTALKSNDRKINHNRKIKNYFDTTSPLR